MKIIQLLVGTISMKDGVGYDVLSMDRWFREHGFQTIIINRFLTKQDIYDPLFSEGNILFYHLSAFADPLVRFLPCKKILCFHNITTPDLLIGFGVDGDRKNDACGMYDMSQTRLYFDYAVAKSNYSKRALINAGWDEKRIFLLPILIRKERFEGTDSVAIRKKYCDGATNILFVGRIYPNKKQEDVIRIFSEYRKNFDSTARLFLVGNCKSEEYRRCLLELIRKEGLLDCVILTGLVDEDEYIAYYRIADLFLCMSAHEGFCIPLVEAMYFGIPVVAVDETAIPDTLGGAGIMLSDRNPQKGAEMLHRILSDNKYKKTILKGQKKRLEELLGEELTKTYEKSLLYLLGDAAVDESRLMTPPDIWLSEEDNKEDYNSLLNVPILQEGCIICGYGVRGKRLKEVLDRTSCHILAICDKNLSNDEEVISYSEAILNYPDANYVITVARQRMIVEIYELLKDAGVKDTQILFYDGKKITE